ncbi:MAG: hypothetical protein H6Q67_100 [Firmicutes bacterium]|nr:hypothetical protein [Bacillota bacterium]
MADSVNLLISILVRYPEIAKISYDADNNTIKLTFFFSGTLTEDRFAATRKVLTDSLEVFHLLEGANTRVVDIAFSTCAEVTMLTILRDVTSLSKGEIALVIQLLRDNCNGFLIADDNEALQEEDLMVQDEVIDSMLENVKHQQQSNGLIGIREDGRVLVFNQ